MYDFNVNLYGKMQVTVVANSKEEALRILNDTIESITVKDFKDKLSRDNNVEIKKSQMNVDIKTKDKNKEQVQLRNQSFVNKIYDRIPSTSINTMSFSKLNTAKISRLFAAF